MALIHLAPGVYVNPDAVTVVKEISEKKCSLWVTGQAAPDGFVLEYSAEEVVQALDDVEDLYEEDDDEGEDGDEDNS